MSDVFRFLGSLEEQHALMRRPHTLERGVLYTTYKFEMQEPDGVQSSYRSLKAFIYDDDVKFYIYMPSKYNKLPTEKVEELNSHIKKNNPPSICFYGKMGKANVIEIHEYGTGVDSALMKKVERIEKLMAENPSSPSGSPVRSSMVNSPGKRRFEDGEGNCSTPKKLCFGNDSEDKQ